MATCGFISSHFTRAFAHEVQAWATRLAEGTELKRLRFGPLTSWWLARWRFRRSARANPLEHICSPVLVGAAGGEEMRGGGKGGTRITGKALAQGVGCDMSLGLVSKKGSPSWSLTGVGPTWRCSGRE